MMNPVDICALDDILPHSGVAALVGDEQVAVFRVDTANTVLAISNHDPFSGANVLARGLVGSLQGKTVVAAPIYKQHFDLETGQCLEDATVTLKRWPVEVVDGRVVISHA